MPPCEGQLTPACHAKPRKAVTERSFSPMCEPCAAVYDVIAASKFGRSVRRAVDRAANRVAKKVRQ